MRSPFEFLVDSINHKPKMVLGVLAGIIVVSLIGMTLISMETGSETYINKDTERGMLLDKYTKAFQSDGIMLVIESDNVLNPDVLAYIDRLHRDIADERHVSGVTGIVDLARQVNGGDLPSSKAEIATAMDRLPAGVLERYAPSNLMTISVVTLDPGLSQEAQAAVLDDLASVISLSEPPPGVHVVVTGNAAFQQQMGSEIGTSMGQLILVAMILMVIAIGLFFSNVRYRFLSILIVATGIILTFGIVGIVGLPITMVTIGAFPVLIGIGIDYAIQFHSRFDEEVRRSSIPEAVRTTVTKAGPSVLYAMIATSMGFFAMLISPVPMIGDFGLVCVIGVASCYLVALIAVPLAGTILKYRPLSDDTSKKGSGKKDKMEHYNAAIGSLAGKVSRNPVPVLILCVLIAFIGFQMDQAIIINTNEDTFVPPDMPAVIDLKKVSRTMGSASSLPIFVRGDNVLDVTTIDWMYDFQQYETAHNDKVTGSRSIADLLIQYNGGMLPGTNSELKQTLERIPDEEKKRYINGNTEAVIEFSTVDMENEVAMSMVDNVKLDLAWRAPPPGITASITGMSEMFSNLIREISNGKTSMTLLAFVLIFLFLFLIYRKVGRAITPVIPIMLIVGWNGLIMFVLGIDYTPMTATLGSMTIGVASEYTILIMERSYEEMDRGAALIPAITHGVSQIGTAITVSGLTTVFGFAALTFSSFNLISNFGIVTVITVGFSLIGAIVVMPAILVLVGRFDQRRRKTRAEDAGS